MVEQRAWPDGPEGSVAVAGRSSVDGGRSTRRCGQRGLAEVLRPGVGRPGIDRPHDEAQRRARRLVGPDQPRPRLTSTRAALPTRLTLPLPPSTAASLAARVEATAPRARGPFPDRLSQDAECHVSALSRLSKTSPWPPHSPASIHCGW